MSNAAEVYVDGMLVVWGERWDWSPKNRKAKKAKQTSTGVRKVQAVKATPAMDAQTARKNLQGFVRKTPQALVKISGGGKGLTKVMNHVSYITRNGEVPEVEDQDGEKISGRDALKDLRLLWGEGRFPIPAESEKREAINIVLSMPEGTDELGVWRAAREFAKAEFGDNHQYVLALHTFSTDPGPRPSKHPHVHLAVKSIGRDGIRLNPRKADLMAWREAFAQALRANGIEAVATRRRTRLQRNKGQPQGLYNLQKLRGEQPRHSAATAQSQRNAQARARKNATEVLRDLKPIAEALAKSSSNDRKLAIDLVQSLSSAAQLDARIPVPGRPMPSSERGSTRE